MITNTINLNLRVWGSQGKSVVFIHGSNIANPESSWSNQHTFAQKYQLLIPDRRGYGNSPPIKQKGFENFESNVQDILALVGTGAHFVGSSYGGIIALLAAAQKPEVVYSLTVIEPPVFDIARGHREIENILERMIPLYATVETLTPEEFISGFYRALGGQLLNPIQLAPDYRQGIIATMTEPPPWKARIPVDILAMTQFPKLVVSGGWHPAFETIADLLAERIGTERAIIRGAGHQVQEMGKVFNERLEALWKKTF